MDFNMINTKNFENSKFSDDMRSIHDYMCVVLMKEYPSPTLTLDYMFLSILENKNCLAYKRLLELSSFFTIKQMVKSLSDHLSSKAVVAIKPGIKLIYDDDLIDIINSAYKEMEHFNDKELTTEHVLLSAINDNTKENTVKRIFLKAGITYSMLYDRMKHNKVLQNDISVYDMIPSENEDDNTIKKMVISLEPGTPVGSKNKATIKSNTKNIDSYCINLNEVVERGAMDPLIGRESEIKQIIQTLGRRKKNNVILIGNEGVGKTAIGEHIAQMFVNGDVPDFLIGKTLISLDMTALMAGTTLRGMFEERVKGVIDEMKKYKRFVLFVDNIGEVFSSKKDNDYDISSMFSKGLENGDFQVIGTCDYKSYRSTFEKDGSLSRRFRKIIVDAPTINDSLNILNGIKGAYEGFHNVKYTDDAIDACVNLANRYVTERNLPDSAIDLMDEAGSKVSRSSASTKIVSEFYKKRSEMEKQMKSFLEKEMYKEADDMKNNLNKYIAETNKKIDKETRKNASTIEINSSVIAEIVSEKTGIPISKLTVDDKKRLNGMDERIKEEVIGQDEAIETICKALKRNRVGLYTNKCAYSALTVGKSGCGKTLVAKKLAKELFGDENALIRFDMSEYPDKTAVNKLIGSNPGYVGYEEGGLLTNSIKNKKFCVLLLDEIEKADPEVYNIFLQVLDEGFLTDNSGMKVDFRNVVILFTSNVGTKQASDFGKGIGFGSDESSNTKRILVKELKKRFPPEFINRLNNVIYFNDLSDDNLKEIIKLELNKCKNRISEIGYGIEFDDLCVDALFDIVVEEKEYGARPIIRAIQTEVEDRVTDLILTDNFALGYTFSVSAEDNTVCVK